MARKSARGRAINNSFHCSARKTAFSLFSQGYRPHQLPDLGVKKESLYRYYQQWKNRHQEFGWRVFKKLLTTDKPSRLRTASLLGLSEEAIVFALKNCRNSAQFKKRLGAGKVEPIDRLISQYMRLYLERVIIRLSKCESVGDRMKEIQVIAKSMDISPGELLLMLNQLYIEGMNWKRSHNNIVRKQLLWILKKMAKEG